MILFTAPKNPPAAERAAAPIGGPNNLLANVPSGSVDEESQFREYGVLAVQACFEKLVTPSTVPEDGVLV